MKDAVLWLLRWFFWGEDPPGLSFGVFSKPNDMILLFGMCYIPTMAFFGQWLNFTYLARNIKFRLLVQGPLPE